MNFKKKQLGLSLLELMVALGMIAVLSSISYTTYQKYAIRANRIEVRNAMDMIAQRLEQNFSITRDFQYYYNPQKPSNRAGEKLDADKMMEQLGYSQPYLVPNSASRKNYEINLYYIDKDDTYGPGFYLQANAVGKQTNDVMCQSFYLNHRNVRKAANYQPDASGWAAIKARGGTERNYTQECWQS